MLRKSFSVFVLCKEYRIMEFEDRFFDAHIDHAQRIIWVSSFAKGRDRVVALAVAQAWEECLGRIQPIG